MLENLGIGSRIRHSRFGPGVVVNEKSAVYTVSFMEHGLREVKKNEDAEVEIIDQLDPDTDMVSMFDVERILTAAIKKYIEYPEPVELAQKWKGGKLVLFPADKNLQGKEFPVDAGDVLLVHHQVTYVSSHPGACFAVQILRLQVRLIFSEEAGDRVLVVRAVQIEEVGAKAILASQHTDVGRRRAEQIVAGGGREVLGVETERDLARQHHVQGYRWH